MLYLHTGGEQLFTVYETNLDTVTLYPQGGGFMHKVSKEEFERDFTLASAKPDWFRSAVMMDDGLIYPCVKTIFRWNGWAIPYFTKEVAQEILAEYLVKATWNPDLATWQWVDEFSGDDQVMTVDTIQFEGVTHYNILDGWCWYEPTPDIQED